MKKSAFISLLLASALLAGCGGAESPSAEESSFEASAEISSEISSEISLEESVEPFSEESVSEPSSEEGTELKIVSQPCDTTVAIPQGCSFEVKVNNEALVKSYMWQVFDGYGKEEEKGPLGDAVEVWTNLSNSTSGRTGKYIKTSTAQNHKEQKYRCIITDINGNEIVSETATLSFTNPDFDSPIVYVGNYAIGIGESLDLSDTENGSGVVTYVSAHELKLSNVLYHNESNISDAYETGTDGIFVIDGNYEGGDFTVTLEGCNVIHNTYWDPNYNSGGIGLNLHFGDNGESSTVIIEGDGSLAITGGSHCIYFSGDVVIKSDLLLNTFGNNYGTGVYAHSITVRNGACISGTVNGAVLHNKRVADNPGNIYIKENSVIDVVIKPQHASTGGAICKALSANNRLIISDSTVSISVLADGGNFDKKHPLIGVAILCTEGSLGISNSVLNLSFRAGKSDIGYCSDVYGIMASADSLVENSNITVDIDSAYSAGGVGVSAKDITFKKSNVNIKAFSAGNVYCYRSSGNTIIKGSDITAVSKSYDNSTCLGFMCTGIKVDAESGLVLEAENGIAFGSLIGKSDEEVKYDSSYVPTAVDFSAVTVNVPSKAKVSVGSVYYASTDGYNKIETVYSESDTASPASVVIIGK